MQDRCGAAPGAAWPLLWGRVMSKPCPLSRSLLAFLVLILGAVAGGCRQADIWGGGEELPGPEETAERAPSPEGYARWLRSLESPPLGLAADEHGPQLDQLRALYAERGHRPIWFVGAAPHPAAAQMVERLAGAGAEGLPPERYGASDLRQRLEGVGRRAEAQEAWELETALTWATMWFAHDLSRGLVRAEHLGERWRLEGPEEADLVAWLATAAEEGDLPARLDELSPHDPQYERLVRHRDRYRAIVEKGGWPTVPTGDVVGAGEPLEPARRAALARRLAIEGFLAADQEAPAAAAPRMSEHLAAAVERFQSSRTLEVDGRLGPETQEELNVRAEDRLRQIELNLDRWRWMPADLGDPAVVVNIPAYRLDVLEGGRTAMQMNVVVGKPDWPTPIFSDRIQYLVLNPYWNVPQSILQEEVVPAVRRDPGYLLENDMEVLAGWGDDAPTSSVSTLLAGGVGNVRVRQRPGPQNPLGQIKFMFPNDDNVYLHDTPATQHFSSADRYLSHGCVRVERPWDLAGFLLDRAGSEVDVGDLRSATASRQPRDVGLPNPIPVHLVYFTAEVDEEGRLSFYEDIYGIDEEQAQLREATLRKVGESEAKGGGGRGAAG
jgi:L,D-transpeptidase YcbB